MDVGIRKLATAKILWRFSFKISLMFSASIGFLPCSIGCLSESSISKQSCRCFMKNSSAWISSMSIFFLDRSDHNDHFILRDFTLKAYAPFSRFSMLTLIDRLPIESRSMLTKSKFLPK